MRNIEIDPPDIPMPQGISVTRYTPQPRQTPEARAATPKHLPPAETAAKAINYAIDAQPYRYRRAIDIPKLDLIYGSEIRGLTSGTVAPPGTGKTKLATAEALAKVTGRRILHDAPSGQLRCLVWFCEEDQDTVDRTITATMDRHNIMQADIGDRLFINTMRQKLVTATHDRNGIKIIAPVMDEMRRFVRQNKIDSITLDPFIKTHEVPENDNTLIDKVLAAWAELARAEQVHVHIYHHTRKMAGGDVTVQDVRGGSAIIGALRHVRVLNRMTKEEAKKAGVDQHWRYFRVEDAKQNNRPPGRADWVKLDTQNLAHGDTNGVATTWGWPDPFASITTEDTRRVQSAVAAGTWRENGQSPDWVGRCIADVLGLDLEDVAAKARVRGLLNTWVRNGILTVVERQDGKRKSRKFVEVGSRL